MAIHFADLNHKKHKEFLILICCLVIGFALRFYTFDQKSLWIDEIHTFNDSRDNLKAQVEFYKSESTFLHPPLFFVLTHMFYPFENPERDLRVIPLVFGILSIPMIYFLSKLFSTSIALPCTLSLTFMVYHIYFSQEGRAYSMLMFLGMVALYLFMQYLKTSEKRYLFFVAFLFAILFYTSYSAIPFILFSQLLWFYNIEEHRQRTSIFSFSLLNGLFFLFCIPWLLFVVLNYKGQPIMDPLHTEGTGSLWSILYWTINDWASNVPLIITSIVLLILFPFVVNNRKNALILLTILMLPIGSLYLLCKFFHVTHFFASKYFITLLPFFLVSIYLSLNAIEARFERLRKFVRPKLLFIVFFVMSNLIILPFYYRSEKQDFRRLVTYLSNQLQGGDRIFVTSDGHILGIIHYFRNYPKDRHYFFPLQKDSKNKIQFRVPFTYKNRTFVIYHSKQCCNQYVSDANRLWIVADKYSAKEIQRRSLAIQKGYFDGSYRNLNKFPDDASMYLFLWDPKSPDEKGIDIPID